MKNRMEKNRMARMILPVLLAAALPACSAPLPQRTGAAGQAVPSPTPAASGAPSDAGREETAGAAAPALPLTADRLTWALEPDCPYQEVEPLRGNSFSDLEGPYSDGTELVNGCFYEMSFPGYSNLPQYYRVQLADGSWRLYYMPDHIDSGSIPMDPEETALNPRYDATGILNYAEAAAKGICPVYPAPWHLFAWTERGSGSTAVYYDTHTGQGVLEGGFYSLNLQPVAQAGLHKPYPAGRLSTEGLDQDARYAVEISIDDADFQHNRDAIDATRQEYPKAYVGTDGQLITDFVYDRAEDFSEGIAACMRDGKWGYIDAQGNEITGFVYDGVWAYSGPFDETLGEYGGYPTEYAAYPCTSDTMVVWQDGQVGLLYRDGTLLIGFGQFEDMAPAYNNELWARQDGKWGLIDLAAAKEQAGLDPELTVPAEGAVPDPPYENYALQQLEGNGDAKPDYPATRSQLGEMLQGRAAAAAVGADTPLYASPDAGTQPKAVVPAGQSVQVLGMQQFVPGWMYISWYDTELTGGWVPADSLNWN